jgi:hypothetical protein
VITIFRLKTIIYLENGAQFSPKQKLNESFPVELNVIYKMVNNFYSRTV